MDDPEKDCGYDANKYNAVDYVDVNHTGDDEEKNNNDYKNCHHNEKDKDDDYD